MDHASISHGSISRSVTDQTRPIPTKAPSLSQLPGMAAAASLSPPPPPPQHVHDNTEQTEQQDEDHLFAEEVVKQQPHAPQAPKQRKLMLSKYTIYVTSQRMYIVGSNNRETMFRILEIDLTQPNSGEELSIIEDNVFFTRNEIMKVLTGLEETSEGGLTKKLTAVGLLGFIRFTQNWYLSVITKKSSVSILGGHYLYHVDATELIPVCNNYKKPDRNSEETRYLMTFANLDLSKTFYYSYTYDLTNCLQKNFLNHKKQAVAPQEYVDFDYNEMFVWNSFLLKPILSASFDRIYDWFQPIIHGFIDQAKISIFDQKIYITVIARRSHHFAGARFLKRGVNDQGNVANEVETEQIVHDATTSPFHDPKGGFFNNPRYTSYVQHRGSIPLSWSQGIGSNLKLQTKPPININVVDPFYSAAALHFDDLFKRYGTPILVLNLIKQREKTPRESKLLIAFEECIEYLNKFLPVKNKINYTSWDMSRASKNRGQDVIEYLENYADETLKTTGFFHNGINLRSTKLQQGVCRTNCIDCLDRTNAAQFIIGKRALGYQLHALGLIDDKYLEYDSDVVNILTEMFHDHGDTIALQYGGSHLVNTMETYRKINQWTSQSRDAIESIKRFYSNSFVDAQRQEAINLFLGNYVWEKGLPMLWDLNTDYYLHHDFLGANLKFKPSYTHWYTDSNLNDMNKAIMKFLAKHHPLEMKYEFADPKYAPYPSFYENYFAELYTPRTYTSLKDVFEYNMNSTLRYAEDAAAQMALQAQQSSPIKANKNHREKDGKTQETEHLETLKEVTSPFETRKPQLINIKLRNLSKPTGESSSDASEKQGLKNEETTSDNILTELDEFNFLKLQIARLFKNFENEYIYYPLSLRKFLNQHSSKLLNNIIKEKENYPVFDYNLNNSDTNNEKSGFFNFNLDGFTSSTNSQAFANHDGNHDYNGQDQQSYRRSHQPDVPKVDLNDELIYYNTVNSMKNLSLNSSVSNEFSTDYSNTRVSADSYDLYANVYNLNNIGNDKDSTLERQLKDNYFGDPRASWDNRSPSLSPTKFQESPQEIQHPLFYDPKSASATPSPPASILPESASSPAFLPTSSPTSTESMRQTPLFVEKDDNSDGYNQFPDIQDHEEAKTRRPTVHEPPEDHILQDYEVGDSTVIHKDLESGAISFDSSERTGLL